VAASSRLPGELRAAARPLLAGVLAIVLAGPAVAASDPLRGRQWGLSRVGAPQAWDAGRGKGITIAVVDSGVDLGHEDLRSRLVLGHDFVDGDGHPQDEEGHGTHVAGIAAAAAGNGRGIAGVAPLARIMPVRVLDGDGTGSASDVAAGIRWAVENGADVINLSLGDLGQPLFGPAFSDALDYAWANGAIPVVAAGNEFLLSSGYSTEPAIVVGATDRNDGKPGYASSVGSARWGMAAPGGAGGVAPREDDILSAYWTPGGRNGYAYLAGTSMAAPHVSGGAAILRSLGLSPQETVDRLLDTAHDIGPPGRDSTFGHGRLNVAAAVRGLSGAGVSSGGSPASGAGGPSQASPAAPPGSGGSAPGPDDPTQAPGETPAGDGPAGTAQDRPVDRDDGFPLAVFGTGLVAVLLAVVIGWTLFRPNPPDE